MTTELNELLAAQIAGYQTATRKMQDAADKYRKARTWMWVAFGGWAFSVAVYIWLILTGIT
jgi:hypothetical protein